MTGSEIVSSKEDKELIAPNSLGRLKLIACFELGFFQVCMCKGEKQNANLEKTQTNFKKNNYSWITLDGQLAISIPE